MANASSSEVGKDAMDAAVPMINHITIAIYIVDRTQSKWSAKRFN